jgi:hypothetical protein
MKTRGPVTVVAGLMLFSLLAGSIICRRHIEKLRGQEATLEEVLYLPSGKTVKRMSLGYSGLLADIYWTRAVQYFGSKHIKHSTRYDLLYPLLDITTDLDPKLIVAYEYGAVFLSQQPPSGAGQPDKAVALVEKGIRANPDYWRLYFTLGFIHYMDRHDPKAAELAFHKGSEVPGALPWMRVMAARMAERSRNIETSMMLWQGIYETTSDRDVKNTAEHHLASLQADRDINNLQHLIQTYRQRTGALPESWADLLRGRLINHIPLAPYGEPYLLRLDGTVNVKDPDQYPYLREWRDNEQVPF